jgi:MurNAc alpha-1-phosphate uridylyltransferase
MKQAMIMAAGLGKRMRPMTDTMPKALIKFRGRPLLDRVLSSLVISGFQRIIINVHHFGDQIIDFLNSIPDPGPELIISDERKELLDTGGGLKKASDFFTKGPVLIHNVDILTNANLNKYWDHYIMNPVPANLMVKDRKTSRNLLFNDEMILCGWQNNQTGEKIIARQEEANFKLAFSGIYILDTEFIDLLPEKKVFPVMPEILKLAKDVNVKGYRHDEDDWIDLGKPESYKF